MDKRFRSILLFLLASLVVYIVYNAVLKGAGEEYISMDQGTSISGEVGDLEGVSGLTLVDSNTTISEAQEIIDSVEIPGSAAYCFRNEELLNSHYEKHGKDMGFASALEYELAASAVVTNPAALHKTEKEDGDDVYYIEDTNEFVVVSTDGYIRTYFCPDSGKAYFDRQ